MLLRQFKYPKDSYSQDDLLLSEDHDRLKQRDLSRVSHCFKTHIGTGEMGFPDWLKNAEDAKVMMLLEDLVASPEPSRRSWTGYRVCASINRSNRYPVFSLGLFAKHPESNTVLKTENPMRVG